MDVKEKIYNLKKQVFYTKSTQTKFGFKKNLVKLFRNQKTDDKPLNFK